MAQSSKSVPEVAHYANGTIKFKGSLLDGEFHGAWEWYRLDGTLMRTGTFDRGKQVGVWRTFDRAGRIVKATDVGRHRPDEARHR